MAANQKNSTELDDESRRRIQEAFAEHPPRLPTADEILDVLWWGKPLVINGMEIRVHELNP